jgi:DNA mismatch repair ATPase MutL
LSTRGKLALKENIVDLFGPKSFSGLLEIKSQEPSASDLSFYDLKGDFSEAGVAVNGYVSSCDHGKGRGSSDRQFYFVNGRPCDATKVAKVVNEIYKQFNKNQVCREVYLVVSLINVSMSSLPVSLCRSGHKCAQEFCRRERHSRQEEHPH